MKNYDNGDTYVNNSSYPYDRTQSVGMAYVPMQEWQNILKLEEGFIKGTIFCELDKPFH